MPDVHAVRHLLANNSSIVAAVPASRIKAGVLPEKTELPAIGIMHVSGIRRNTVAGGGPKLVTCRVQVTVMAANYPQKKDILKLVHDALADHRGAVDTVTVDSILSDIEGPDLDQPEAKIFSQSNDFIVKYTS